MYDPDEEAGTMYEGEEEEEEAEDEINPGNNERAQKESFQKAFPRGELLNWGLYDLVKSERKYL